MPDLINQPIYAHTAKFVLTVIARGEHSNMGHCHSENPPAAEPQNGAPSQEVALKDPPNEEEKFALSVSYYKESGGSSVWLRIKNTFISFLEKFIKDNQETKEKETANVTHSQWEKTKNLIQLSETLEKRIQFESSWIGQRMSWLVVSQSFLFTAFVNAASKTQIFKLKQTSESAPGNADYLVTIIPAIIMILGLIQAFSAFVSILSAKRVNAEQAVLRGKIDNWIKEECHPKALFDHWPLLGKKRWTYHFGAFASWMIPLSLIVAWILLLLYFVRPDVRPLLDFQSLQ